MAVNYESLQGAGSALGTSAQLGADLPNVRELHSNPDPLDATLPPTPIRELLAASGATLFILATDASLVSTIRRAAEQHPLYVVETWHELLQAVESERCGIALLDAAVLGARVPECVGALAAYADRLVTLVAAERSAAHQYIGFLSDGHIHRLLIKPTAVGAARLLIESATARRLQLRDEAAQKDAAQAAVAAPRRPTKRPIAAAAVLAVAVLAAVITGSRLGWWERFLPVETTPAASAVAPPPVEPASTVDERLADLRTKADLARQEGRLAEPVGDNALDHYRAILALAPQDQAARDGLSSVVEALFARAEQALLADELASAASALDQARRVAPSSSRLAFLDAQLARALAALPVPQPTPAATAPVPTVSAPTELDSTLSLATARLRRGQLLSPAGDSAREYLDRAMQLGANDPRVTALRTDLAAALIAAARLLSSADVPAATSLAAEARRLGPATPDLLALEDELAAARARTDQARRTAAMAAALARMQSGALFAPAGDSALDHLSALHAEAPAFAGLAEAWGAFLPAAVLAVQGVLDRSEWAVADAQLAALARAPGGADAAAPLAAELAARRLQETYLATPGPASVLKLVSGTPAVYPPDALARGIEGWVDLELIVDRAGLPRDVAVTAASPPGRFDDAALDAVMQYRYAPFEQDGRVYERRIRMRVRFQVQGR